jgi:MFS family permease
VTDQTTDEPRLLPSALTEPTEHVRSSWIAGLGLASLAMWMASLTPLQVLIPEQLQAIDPKGKIVALAYVSAFGAVASALATPIAGALSDRTTHAFGLGRMRGRRHRWTLVMAVLAAICLALMASQSSVLGLVVLWVLFSLFQNGEFASLSAAVPDHVPVNQRATVAPARPAATWHWPFPWSCSPCRSCCSPATIRSARPTGPRCRCASCCPRTG